MKVLLDECIVQDFRHAITGHTVFTVGYMGWDSVKNGRLLARAGAAGFDAMISTDRGIEHQQNPQALPLSVYILNARSNDLADLIVLTPNLLTALSVPPTRPQIVHVRL